MSTARQPITLIIFKKIKLKKEINFKIKKAEHGIVTGVSWDSETEVRWTVTNVSWVNDVSWKVTNLN